MQGLGCRIDWGREGSLRVPLKNLGLRAWGLNGISSGN